MLRLSISSPQSENDTVVVERFPFSVGRGSTDDYRSDAHGVWEKHFQLQHVDHAVVLTTGPNGTTIVDGTDVQDSVVLKNGAIIKAGSLRLQFNIAEPEVRPYGYREAVTWAFVFGVTILQIYFLVSLPR